MLKDLFARTAACFIVAIGPCACVTLPPNAPRSAQDPFESFNRGVYKFNDAIDRGVVKPAAKGYTRVVPKPVRIGISNVFSNLEQPTVMINAALQGKLRASANDLGRFLFNLTAGVGGLLDPATRIGMDRNDADFGQTLGVWGVHAGPFVELPLFGPSDMRDAPGKLVDTYTNPKQYIFSNTYVKYGVTGLSFLNTRAELLSLDSALTNVYDPYTFIRDAYLQHRAYKISGQVPDEAPLVDPDAPAPAPLASPPTH